jgi:hypothetical protein
MATKVGRSGVGALGVLLPAAALLACEVGETASGGANAGGAGEGGAGRGQAFAGGGGRPGGAGRGGEGGAGASGVGAAGSPCDDSLTVTVRGEGFDAFEGVTVWGTHFAAQSCPFGKKGVAVAGGAFTLEMTTGSGYGAVELFLDANGDGERQPNEPDWSTRKVEGAPVATGYHAWLVAPSDFAAVRHVRLTGAGLPAAYEGLMVTSAQCAGVALDAACEFRLVGGRNVQGGAFDFTEEHAAGETTFFAWVGDGDEHVTAGELLAGPLAAPTRCSVDGHLTTCALTAADFGPASGGR